jgi:hypothetical protein
MSLPRSSTERQPNAGVFVEGSRAPTPAAPHQYTPSDLAIVRYLRRLSRAYATVFPSVAMIASRTGLSRRTVQLRMPKLAAAGVLEIIPDATVKTGRRFVLAPPRPRSCAPDCATSCAPDCAQGSSIQQGGESLVSPPAPATTTTSSTTTPDPEHIEALDWWLGTSKARGVRNRDGFRRVALARGVDASIVEAWRASRMPQERPSAHGRVPVDPEAERAEAASVAAFLAAAKDDPSNPLFSVMRRRVGV